MESTSPTNSYKLNPRLDFRLISLLLLAAIGIMLFIWKPWDTTDQDRTIDVTGEAKLTARPDEFAFSPSYEFKNDNKDAALTELTKKSDDVVAKLKELGIADDKIKTTSSGYDYPVYFERDPSDTTYTLQMTVTVDNLELAQKVQDYLVSTAPTGQVSPQANFSDAKRKELEKQARDEAAKDARAKAEQTARNLGFKLGKVKSLTDSQGFGLIPYAERGGVAADAAEKPQLTIQPGENELNYAVTVVYYIR